MTSEAKPIIIIDTREQKPYDFPGYSVLRKALPSGDYSILGHEQTFAIERKELTDLLGCIFTPRFTRELERLQQFAYAYLVIESNIWKIKNNRFYRGNPNSVLGKLQAIAIAYGVQVLFLDDRATAQAYVEGLITKYCRHVLKGGVNSDAKA